MTQSTSALVSRIVEMGEAGEEGAIDNSGAARICWRRSGEAFSRNQWEGSAETATCACVRGRAFKAPLRRPLQFGQPQFHWGKPPPAAEPRTLTRIPAQSRARRWRTS